MKNHHLSQFDTSNVQKVTASDCDSNETRVNLEIRINAHEIQSTQATNRQQEVSSFHHHAQSHTHR